MSGVVALVLGLIGGAVATVTVGMTAAWLRSRLRRPLATVPHPADAADAPRDGPPIAATITAPPPPMHTQGARSAPSAPGDAGRPTSGLPASPPASPPAAPGGLDMPQALILDLILANLPLDRFAQRICEHLASRHDLTLAWIGIVQPSGDLAAMGRAGPAADLLCPAPETLPLYTLGGTVALTRADRPTPGEAPPRQEGSAAASGGSWYPDPATDGDDHLGPASRAVLSGRPVLLRHPPAPAAAAAPGATAPQGSPQDPASPAWVQSLPPCAVCCLPLKTGDRALGVLALAVATTDDRACAAVQAAVQPLADQVGAALPLLLDQHRHRLQAIAINAVGDAIYITDTKGRVEWVNPAYLRMTGFRAPDLIGKIPAALCQDGDEIDRMDSGEADREALWNTIRSGRVWRGELSERRKDGRLYVVNQTVTPIRNETGAVTHFVAVHEDVTARKKAEERIRYLANYDTLTRLPNRILFRDRLDQAVLQARRVNGPLAVMFIDLDHFSRVNDTLGHAVGDLFLMTIASRINAAAGQADTVARIGGDEFAVILTLIPSPEAVTALARHLMEVIRTPIDLGEHEVRVGANIGIALYPQDGMDPETLVKNADLAMYRAIRSEDENCLFFSKEMNIETSARLGLEGDLRRALEAGDQLHVHYQLQYSMRTGLPSGAEALIRWTHPRHGPIPPSRIIAVAEDSGLIHQLGDFVLRTALAQYADWRAQGCGRLLMAVNISAVQFRQQGLVTRVLSHLANSGVPATDLELELTESMLMQDADQAVEILEAFSRAGIKLAIDDFGTGYSSLSYLKRFKVDRLKVDQSFVRNVIEGENDAVIARAVINLGHSLGLEVIAEGVETQAQYAYLKNEGCDSVQGFLLARPQPADKVLPELLATLRRGNASVAAQS